MAENMANYTRRETLYATARTLDPADPAPLRYLGELYRHQTGDWDKARVTFQAILDMPRRSAVARGRAARPRQDDDPRRRVPEGPAPDGAVRRRVSAAADLSQSRRLLALGRRPREGRRVHEEGARARSRGAVQRRVRGGVRGRRRRRARARRRSKVAQAHEDLLCASYNLAAIYAQLGERNKALALLKRHFYEYERYDAVRSKEMMEARVDAVFASIVEGPRVRVAHRERGRQAADAARRHVTDGAGPTIRCSRRSRAPRPGS